MSKNTWNDVVKKALDLLYHADQYMYCLGGQGEPQEQLAEKIKYYYGLSLAAWNTRYGTGKKLMDCSGLVNLCAGKPRSWTSAAYAQNAGVTPKDGLAGYALYKKGHVGIDIGHGFFVHIPTVGHTVELGKIADYDWTSSHPIPGVDYTGASAK